MPRHWTIAGKYQSHVLANAETAENFWQTLPRHDPFAMQRRMCDELAIAAGCERLDADRFRALRRLDQHAHRPLEGLLSEYAALGGQSTALEHKLRHAALALSRAFADEFERFIRVVSGPAPDTAWRKGASELAVRLFRHREIELVLVLSRSERWPRGRWKSLHDAYRYALSMDVATQAVPLSRRSDGSVIAVTPEQEYIRILLLQLMDDGRFRPEEIAWARRQIGRWSGALALQRLHPMINHSGSPTGFVVDLTGTGGLTRIPATGSGETLWIDTTPITRAIDGRMAKPRSVANTATTSVQAQIQYNLLCKLRDLYAPRRAHLKRRGERTTVVLTSVDATLGDLQTIIRMLRDDARAAIEASNVSVPHVEEIAITDAGSVQGRFASSSADAAPHQTRGARIAPHATWHIRDRSDSGARLRGRLSGTRPLIPGLLIAFRNDKADPWTVAVVRRSTRLIGNNVELGVEHLGRDPQRVILLSGAPSAQDTDAQPDRIAALYLPKSKTCPRIPIRTLLMPTCEFAPDRVMTMRSRMNQVVIRLKEPLEQQANFVWTSFEPVEIAADGWEFYSTTARLDAKG